MLNATKTRYEINKRTFVSREEWKAVKAKVRKPIKTPVPYMVFTYTHCQGCENKAECMKRLVDVQTCQMLSCGMPDIRFNFMIGGDGRIYEGRGWNFTTQKISPSDSLAPLNDKYYSIGFICVNDKEPTEEMEEAAEALIREGIEKNYITKEVKVTTTWSPHTIPRSVRNMKNVKCFDPDHVI